MEIDSWPMVVAKPEVAKNAIPNPSLLLIFYFLDPRQHGSY